MRTIFDIILDWLIAMAVLIALYNLYQLMDDTKDPVAKISQIKEECLVK